MMHRQTNIKIDHTAYLNTVTFYFPVSVIW